jgi:ppGpp synthetase/RelA/SpoT-type nucleotidyltranferase
MDWRLKRKDKALRNALIRVKNNKSSVGLLEKRIKEADSYLCKLKKKQERGWFK